MGSLAIDFFFKKKSYANVTDVCGAFLRVAVNVISVEFPMCLSAMYFCVNGT